MSIQSVLCRGYKYYNMQINLISQKSRSALVQTNSIWTFNEIWKNHSSSPEQLAAAISAPQKLTLRLHANSVTS